MRLNVLLMFAALFIAPRVWSQETLPQGIGLYQFGQRTYAEQVESYNHAGNKVPIGSRFDRSFDGQTMLSGKAGADLKRLADELVRFEGSNPSTSGLLNRLTLGDMTGEVKANVNARFVGLGFGINDSLTFFFGVPYISATVESEVFLTGENNAQLIKNELGDLAYDELKDGLDEASRLNVDTVRQNILDAGYEPFEKWEHSGYGDMRLGFRAAFSNRLGSGLRVLTVVSPTLELPTGYVEQPDLLTDVSFGKGYYALHLGLEERLLMGRSFWLGGDGTFTENFSTKIAKRLPEDNETLVAADRKTTVTMVPGDDVDTGVSIGAAFGWFTSSYRMGVKRHFSDSYSGSLSGNYEALSVDSSTYQQYQQVKLAMSTADAFRRKLFLVPFILSLTANQPVTARNSTDETYYELSIASFFSTPMARAEGRADKKKQRSKKKRNSSYLTKSSR